VRLGTDVGQGLECQVGGVLLCFSSRKNIPPIRAGNRLHCEVMDLSFLLGFFWLPVAEV